MSDAVEAYRYRAANSDDPIGRFLSPFVEPYNALIGSPVIGTGMASTHGVALVLTGSPEFWWLSDRFSEDETTRVVQETGLVGFLLVYGMRLWLVGKAIALGLRFRTPLFAAISGGIAAFLIQCLPRLLINDPTTGIYYWFAAGLLFAMCRLELQETKVSSSNEMKRSWSSPGARRWKARDLAHGAGAVSAGLSDDALERR
jgi:hypothetical protein